MELESASPDFFRRGDSRPPSAITQPRFVLAQQSSQDAPYPELGRIGPFNYYGVLGMPIPTTAQDIWKDQGQIIRFSLPGSLAREFHLLEPGGSTCWIIGAFSLGFCAAVPRCYDLFSSACSRLVIVDQVEAMMRITKSSPTKLIIRHHLQGKDGLIEEVSLELNDKSKNAAKENPS